MVVWLLAGIGVGIALSMLGLVLLSFVEQRRLRRNRDASETPRRTSAQAVAGSVPQGALADTLPAAEPDMGNSRPMTQAPVDDISLAVGAPDSEGKTSTPESGNR